MPKKQTFKMGIINDKDEIIVGPYEIKAYDLEDAREQMWDRVIGWDLHADEVEDPEKPELMNNLALMVAKELTADTVEENMEILRSLNSEGVVSDKLYDYILANWDRLVV